MISYIISITRNDVPNDDKFAWTYMEELYNTDNGQSSKDFIDLIKKLTEKYCCICDLPNEKVDDGVWSDGPLVSNAGNKITTLGVVLSQVDNVIPFIIETSNNLGFVVFDGQTGSIFRPSQNNIKPKKKRFWSKVFGK